eukprot:gene6229-6466_t
MAVGGSWSTTFEVVGTKAGTYTVNGIVSTTSTESNTANNFDGATAVVVDVPAPPEATCSDSTPESVRGVPVPCSNRSTVFDSNKANSKPADFQNCCLATCANINVLSATPVPQTCPPGTIFNTQNNLTIGPSAEVCCMPGEVVVLPDVSVTIDAPRKATVGLPFNLDITVVGQKGPSSGINNVTMVYSPPEGIQLTDAALPAGCSKSGVSLVCTYSSSMPVGTIWDIKAEVVASRPGDFTNTATVSARNDTNPANNIDSTITTMVAAGTCANAFVCNPGTLPNPAAANSTSLTFQTCCLATCSNTVVNSSTPVPFKCPNNTNPVEGSLSTTVSETACCSVPAVPPTCGNTVPGAGSSPIPFSACPQYTSYNPNTSSISPPNGPNCCTKTCGNVGATTPPVSYAAQCSPPLPAFNPDSSWSTGPNGQPDKITCCTTSTDPSSAVSVNIQKTSNVSSINVGQAFDFTLTVAVSALDIGAVAENVVVVDILPMELQFVQPPKDFRCSTFGQVMNCRLGDLEHGTYPITVSVVAAKAGTSVVNLATVFVTNDEPTSDNTDTKNVTILGACCNPTTGVCTNKGSAAACTGTFTPDKSCGQVQCSANQGTCSNSIPGATPPVPFSNCAKDTLPNPDAANVQPPSRENCCLATCANIDVNSDTPRRFPCSVNWQYIPNAANQTTLTNAVCCERSTPPQAVPDVSIRKRVNKANNLPVGAQVVYTLLVRVESGEAGIDNVVVRDILPLTLDLVSVRTSKPGGRRTSSSQEVVCTLNTMALEELQTVTINALTTRAGNYTNTAIVSGTGDSDSKNNEASVSITVLVRR